MAWSSQKSTPYRIEALVIPAELYSSHVSQAQAQSHCTAHTGIRDERDEWPMPGFFPEDSVMGLS